MLIDFICVKAFIFETVIVHEDGLELRNTQRRVSENFREKYATR